MKKLFRNLERSTVKLERKKSHLMFNEICYTVSDKFIHTPSFFLYSLHNLKTIIAMDLEFSLKARSSGDKGQISDQNFIFKSVSN